MRVVSWPERSGCWMLVCNFLAGDSSFVHLEEAADLRELVEIQRARAVE